jgi:hypothetical protein
MTLPQRVYRHDMPLPTARWAAEPDAAALAAANAAGVVLGPPIGTEVDFLSARIDKVVALCKGAGDETAARVLAILDAPYPDHADSQRR